MKTSLPTHSQGLSTPMEQHWFDWFLRKMNDKSLDKTELKMCAGLAIGAAKTAGPKGAK